MNRGQIRSNVIATLRESATPTGWSPDELNRYINDVYSDTAKETKAVILMTDIAANAGESYIELPRGVVQILSLIDKTTGKPIDPVDWYWIDGQNRTFIQKENIRARYFAAFGMQKIMLYPKYSVSSTITATLVMDATPMTDDADVPELPQEYHRSIVYGTTHRAMMKDASGKRFQRAMQEFSRWQKSLGNLSKWANERHEKISLVIGTRTLRNARGGTVRPGW